MEIESGAAEGWLPFTGCEDEVDDTGDSVSRLGEGGVEDVRCDDDDDDGDGTDCVRS